MNLAKQFREFGVLNSINPLPPDAQVFWYNLMQCFNATRWAERKLVVRTQTLENLCGMTRKRLAVCRNTLIQRGLIHYYPAKQASGSPTYELVFLYDTQEETQTPVFPTETHKGTQEGTHKGTQEGTQPEHLLKTNKTETKQKQKETTGPPAPVRKFFLKPELAEIENYFFQITGQHKNAGLVAKNFFDYYEANGWKVGKSKMSDWKAAARNCLQWEKNQKLLNEKFFEHSGKPAARAATTVGRQLEFDRP